MNLSEIIVTEDEAKAKLAEYSEIIRDQRNAEDEAILAAYRAAARGLQVISLPEVISAGGMHDNDLPRLAIARASETMCNVTRSGPDLIYDTPDPARWDVPRNRGALVGKRTVRVRVGPIPWHRGSMWHGSAPVPLIPPRHRPRRYRLSRCHILWEVETWSPVPARDPALLRHIRGDLWAVLAAWDLTEIERAVLAGRL